MKKKKSLLGLCFNLFIVALLCSIGFIYYFNRKLGPSLIECAENEVRRITTLVINNGIRKYIGSTTNLDKIIQITRNNQNEIELISYNTTQVNQMLSQITTILEDDLGYMVKGDFEEINLNLNNISDAYYSKINDGIIFSVSFGSATGNSLLANVGPKIPLNLSLVEGVMTDVDTKITEYGMNNAMLEVFIKVSATTVIQMPFLSKQVKVESKIPLTMEVIQGNLPNYYLGNSLNSH